MNNKIRVVTSLGIGDALWAEPAICLLTKHYKKIIVYTRLPELFENYPHPQVHVKNVNKLFLLKKRWIKKYYPFLFFKFNLGNKKWFNKYGPITCLDYHFLKREHILSAYCKILNIPYNEQYPKIYLSESEKSKVFNKKYVLLHLTDQSQARKEAIRNIHGIDWNIWINVAKQDGYEVFYISNKYMPHFLRHSNAQPLHVSLRNLMVWISQASYFIGMDSGPSHIAASLHIPSLLAFGNAIEFEYRHYASIWKGVFLGNNCEKRGCYNNPNNIRKECLITSPDHYLQCCTFTTQQVLQGWKTLQEKYPIPY